jgi:hypothetical protein
MVGLDADQRRGANVRITDAHESAPSRANPLKTTVDCPKISRMPEFEPRRSGPIVNVVTC